MKSAIINAEADAQTIELIGKTARNNPAYLELERIKFSQQISQVISKSHNKIVLDSDILQVNILGNSKETQA